MGNAFGFPMIHLGGLFTAKIFPLCPLRGETTNFFPFAAREPQPVIICFLNHTPVKRTTNSSIMFDSTEDLRKTESPVARGLYKANINLPPESSIMKEST